MSHILLVDDEPAILSALARKLSADGYHILIAQSGPEALDILTREHVTVLLTDQRMPRMSGVKLLVEARRRYPDVVRVVLSGNAGMDAALVAVNDGAAYKYLAKPWAREELRASIRDAMRHHALEQRRKRLVGEIEAASGTLDALNRELRGLVVGKEAALAYAASHDAVTGLPKRVLYGGRLEQALAHAYRAAWCRRGRHRPGWLRLHQPDLGTWSGRRDAPGRRRTHGRCAAFGR